MTRDLGAPSVVVDRSLRSLGRFRQGMIGYTYLDKE